jgi:hypothetical protein
MTIYQVEGNRLTGSFGGVAVASGVMASALGALRPGVVDGTVSSDGMTFSGNWYELPMASGPATKGTFSLTRNASASLLNGTFSSGGQSQNVSANKQGTTPIGGPAPGAGGQAPRITSIRVPGAFPLGTAVRLDLTFTDADGDVVRVLIEERVSGS